MKCIKYLLVISLFFSFKAFGQVLEVAPTIYTFAPATGGYGTVVQIKGKDFIGSDRVIFGPTGSALSFTIVSDTLIIAVVAFGETGFISVGKLQSGGLEPTLWGTSSSIFTFYMPPPVINSFTPIAAGSGAEVQISGSEFKGFVTVYFGGVIGTETQIVSENLITTHVPETAVSGSLIVRTPGGYDTAYGFTVLPKPVVNSFSPAVADTFTLVTIKGENFSGASAVSFGGISATNFTLIDSTKIIAHVGTGASGNVAVTTAGGTGVLAGFTFAPGIPVIYSFAPDTAASHSTVIIKGQNFLNATQVIFGDSVAESFSIVSDSVIAAVVGNGSSGKITVKAATLSASQAGFYFKPATVTIPVISSFYPHSGAVGSLVTIKGHNFGKTPANNLVYFGAVRANVIAASDTQLVVNAPAGASYEPFSVSVNGRTGYSSTYFSITFLSEGNLDSTSFAAPVSLPADHPGSICLNDVDTDGKPDISFGQWGGAYASRYYRNTGTPGTLQFAAPQDVQADTYAPSHVLGDLNADASVEMIIPESLSGAVAYYNNTSTPGTISFAAKKLLPNAGFIGLLAVTDFDIDGRPDFIFRRSLSGFATLLIIKNVTVDPQQIAFSSERDSLPVNGLYAIGDLDNDGRPDIIAKEKNDTSLSFFKNTSVQGLIGFRKMFLSTKKDNGSIFIKDVNNDGKLDIVTLNGSQFFVYFNQSSFGNFSFDAPLVFNLPVSPISFDVNDINGDGKMDYVYCSSFSSIIDGVYVGLNSSSGDTLSFSSPLSFPIAKEPTSIKIGDVDMDGKPEIFAGPHLAVEYNYANLYVLHNEITELSEVKLCPPVTSTLINSLNTATVYQWQVNTGSGFVDLVNNLNYSGVNTSTLQLNNIPSEWTGYKYRCKADSKTGKVFVIKFANAWTGSMNGNWENPANWSCATLPDRNTDVTINSGNVVISSNVICRTLSVMPGATIIVMPGFNLTITH